MGLEDKTLIFIHIPKAGGITLCHTLLRLYDPSHVYWLHSPDLECAGELSKLPIDQRRQLKVLMGHMPFGLHALLTQQTSYITFLRDPIERTLSYYSYVSQRHPDDLYYDAAVNKMSLEDYLKSGLFADNDQTRRLAGIPSDEPCTIETLEIAKRNLHEYFSGVGITKYYDETLIMWKQLFGWSMPYYKRENITKQRLSREEVTPETLKIIENQNGFDIQLYQHVKDLIEGEIQMRHKSFNFQVQGLRMLNRFYSVYTSLPTPIKGITRKLAATFSFIR